MKFQVFLDTNLPCSNNQEGLIKAIQEHASLSKREMRVGVKSKEEMLLQDCWIVFVYQSNFKKNIIYVFVT